MTLPRALLLLPLIALLLGGCTVGTYDYKVTPALTGKPGTNTVTVVGVDDRNSGSPGRFKPRYVGLIRDVLLAIPYFIDNKDKKPIAETLAENVAQGLVQSGYRARCIPNPSLESHEAALAAARSTGAARILLVRVYKFESDSQIRTEFGYDITFTLYNAAGRQLAFSRVHDIKMYPPSFSAYLSSTKNLPRTIRQALADGVSPLMKDL